MVTLCEHMGADIAVHFDQPGAPMLAEPHFGSAMVSSRLAARAGCAALQLACCCCGGPAGGVLLWGLGGH
jgi:hypothetical protein